MIKELLTIIIAILAVLLGVIAIISNVGMVPTDVDLDSIGSEEIIDNSITTSDILDKTIDTTDLSNNLIDAILQEFAIPNDKVISATILDGSITKDDIGDNSVGSDEIEDGSIDTQDIRNDSITSDKLASDALSWNNINGIPIEIFAAGYIKSDKTVEYGYNVLSVDYNSVSKFYTINTSGYKFGDNYITVVSTYGLATSSQVAHRVYGPTIWLFNSTGHYQQSDFYFVTYKIN